MALYYDNQMYDFRKFNSHFQASLIKELDFQNEVVNMERCRNCFYGYDDLYMPQPYLFKSSKRAIVMEFVRGHKVDELDKIKQ
jgi:predicted unusual protein kinase regulating ubiquinone biosynthesis (AarF/ABC1/UbiB family)